MSNKTRTQAFISNTVSTAFYQLVVMIAGFIIPKVLINSYGSEINGLVSSITQFVSYFNLVEAGISGAGVFALYKPLANNDYPKINGIVSAVKRFYYQSGYIFAGLVLVLSLVYPFFISIPQ